MFHKMPIILLGVFLAVIALDGYMPIHIKSILYAISLLIKSGIICVLPFVIFMLLFKTLSKLALNATKIIVTILCFVCASNFLSTMISYAAGSGLYHFDLSLALPQIVEGLQPAWSFAFPKLIANDHAMFAGIILGIGFSYFQPGPAEKISIFFEKAIHVILSCITCVIPVFMAGFAIKLINDKVMESIVRDYALIFLLVAAAMFSYVGLIYLITSHFRLRAFWEKIKNMLPAAIAGFGSMSSAAAMPLTILGTEKNVKNTGLVRLLIPTTVNIHLIGDCFAIPIFAFAVMKNFGMPEPAFLTYVIFALYFVMAKFSVAAIPGGGIIVMLPILESHLGFTGEMASLITALYILFDPVITCANVFGNGAFALAFSQMQRKNQALEQV